MAERRLMRRVEEVAGRLQRVRRLRFRSRIWLILAVAGVALLAANRLLAAPLLSPAGSLGAGLGLLALGALVSLKVRASWSEAAASVERRYPDLDARLVTALGLRPNMDEGGFSYLQHEVISESLLHAQRHDWREAVPTRSLRAAKVRQTAALAMMIAAFTAAALTARRPFDGGVPPTLALAPQEVPADEYGLSVEPGTVQLERGTSLLVLARFAGRLPAQVTLVTSAADGARSEQPLSKSLEDPLFGGRVAQVETDLNYHVRFDGGRSEEFRVTVFDYPELQQADATIHYPEYTGIGEKRIEDVRRVSVVEGSRLTLTCTLNKAVAVARLFADDGTDYELTPDPAQPNVLAVTWQPREKQTLTLELIDEAQRHNRQPPQFLVDVIPNQPPDLKVAFPARDMRVSPLQELPLEAQVFDDFGLEEVGLVYQLPRGDEQTLKLGGAAAADARVDLTHQISFESLDARPNDLVSYYFYADDVGPGGEKRRTMSNMYFAEVRHFDEIYRQMVSSGSPGQGQPGQNMPSNKLLELQREIVTANWNLIRREQGEPSPRLPEDAGTIADSQAQALDAAGQLQSMLEDAISRQHLKEATQHMQAGETQLRKAADTPAVAPLAEARVSTQAAYSALLKLQAREFLVQQSQSAQSAASSGQQQKLNDQLNQLELKNNRNRYESEQQDAPPADREAMQLLNRLRELARRQGDMNEKIQELENALRAAESDEQREEIERQLKRLREEQQQLLRDLDEVQERMEKPENRSRMADARQQLEQTREHLRQTKEALQSGQLSKALAEGTRAERQLEDLKDQFRDQTAGQFAESMRQLRDDVRELADKQQQLGDQLAGGERPNEAWKPRHLRPQLRDQTAAGRDLPEAFEEQKQHLSEVLQDAEEIVRQSELSEPLLSKKLYDAVRKTRVDEPERSLDMTNQFLKLGLKQEAAKSEQQARQGIGNLREGIEEAAESVLGNDIASLQRAQREVDELARAIADELAQADPGFADELQQPRRQQQNTDARQSDASGEPADDAQSSRDQQPNQDGNSDTQQPGEKQNADSQQSGQTPAGQQERQPGQSGRESSNQQGRQPSDGTASQQPGQSPGQRQEQRGQRPSDPDQSGQSQQGQTGQAQTRQGQSGQGQQPSTPSQPAQANAGRGQNPGSSSQPGRGGDQSSRDNPLSAFLQQGGSDGRGGSGPHLGPNGPLTTSEFTQWSDRMRDVEEMLDDPQLRAAVARIRDTAREMRIEVKRHSRQPDWELVRLRVYGPMLDLQDRLAEEIARLEPDSEEMVPLDRDPVPDRYAELVRRYYERLGSGR